MNSLPVLLPPLHLPLFLTQIFHHIKFIAYVYSEQWRAKERERESPIRSECVLCIASAMVMIVVNWRKCVAAAATAAAAAIAKIEAIFRFVGAAHFIYDPFLMMLCHPIFDYTSIRLLHCSKRFVICHCHYNENSLLFSSSQSQPCSFSHSCSCSAFLFLFLVTSSFLFISFTCLPIHSLACSFVRSLARWFCDCVINGRKCEKIFIEKLLLLIFIVNLSRKCLLHSLYIDCC